MLLEVVGAIGLAGFVFWLVFEPALSGRRGAGLPSVPEPEAPEETRRGLALLALKEIEFDKETGKLSDADYQMLKGRYSREAIAALEAEAAAPAPPARAPAAPPGDPEELISARLQLLRSARSTGSPGAPSCPRCGPRPEADALYCSRCGYSLAGPGFCVSCGAPVAAGSRFCAACGGKVAA